MKNLILISILAITSCSSPDSINNELSEFKGKWVSGCDLVYRNDTPSGEYAINILDLNNGSYTSNFTLFSDTDCVNEASKAQEEIGLITFIEEVVTDTGLTARKVNFKRLSQSNIASPNYDRILYIDNNILYLGDFFDGAYVLIFSKPYININ